MLRVFYFATAAFLLASVIQPAAAARPNVILIMADDFGYECDRRQRRHVVQDAEARQARRRRRAVRALLRAAALHADARAAHDRQVQRAQLHRLRQPGPAGDHVRQPASKGRLRHLHRRQVAARPRPGPAARTSASTNTASGSTPAGRRATPIPGLEINGVEKDFKNGEYGPDLVNDYALDFITRHKDEPFFLYYPMMLTHARTSPRPTAPTGIRRRWARACNQDHQALRRHGRRTWTS